MRSVKSRKKTNQIIVHCTGSDRPQDDGIEVIRAWHLARGWEDIGYHIYISKNRRRGPQIGRPLHSIGAHCLGQNHDSIGICVSGNYEFFDFQMDCLRATIQILAAAYKITTVLPHNFYNKNKTCPNFELPI